MNVEEKSEGLEHVDDHHKHAVNAISAEVYKIIGEYVPVDPVTSDTELRIGGINESVVPINEASQPKEERDFWKKVKDQIAAFEANYNRKGQ